MNTKKFIDALSDSRFNSLNENNIVLSLWILTKGQENIFVYGRTLASSNPNVSCSIRSINEFKIGNKHWVFRCLTAFMSVDRFKSFLTQTLNGETLAQSTLGMEIPSELKDWRIFGDFKNISENYEIGEITFCEIEEIKHDTSLQITSPSKDVPSWCVSVVCINKTKPVEPFASSYEAEELIKQCIYGLKEETGQPWNKGEISRLWNFDVFSFPTASVTYDSFVDLELTGNGKTKRDECTVSISPNALEVGTKILVNLQQITGAGILFDKTVPAEIGTEETKIFFKDLADIGLIKLRIWIQDKDSYQIWFSKEYAFIQSVNIGIGIIGLQGSIDSEWLSQIKAGTLAKRASQLRRIKHISHASSFTVGNSPPAVFESYQQSQQLSKLLFPEPSDSRFFVKGWLGKEHGKLGFMEWFKDIVKNRETCRFLLVDPYFDKDSLEFFLRIEETRHIFEILTNTQVRSLDAHGKETKRDLDKEPQRATRIKESCNNLGYILHRLNLRILDLRSKNGGSSQLFHDRYLIVFDNQNIPIKGFNLSNSLQGATKHTPLLITSIPQNALSQVCDYVAMLLEAREVVSESEVVMLYDSIATSKKISSSPASDERPFFALALKNPAIRTFPIGDLHKMLEEKGLIDNNGHYCYNESFKDPIHELFQELTKADFNEFCEIWEAVGSCLAKSVDENLYEYIRDEAFSLLQDHLLSYLKFFSEKSDNLPEAITGYAYMFNTEDFSKLLKNAKFCIGRLPLIHGVTWAVSYTVKIFMDKDSDTLIRFWDKHLLPLITPKLDSFSVPLLRLTTIGLIIFEHVSQKMFITPECVSPLLTSKTPIFRAAAAQALSPFNFHTHIEWKSEFVLNLIINLSDPIERLLSVAEWIGDLRVAANRASREEESVRMNRLKLSDWIISNWVESIDTEQVRDIVRRMSGPIEGSWAMSTTIDFLMPLIDSGKAKLTSIENIWTDTLLEAMSQQLNDTSQFFYSSHSDLTKATAFLMVHLTKSDWKEVIDRIDKLLKNAEHFYWRPLSHSIDYSQWVSSVQTILWIGAFLSCIVSEHNASKVQRPELYKITDLFFRINEILCQVDLTSIPAKALVQFFEETKSMRR